MNKGTSPESGSGKKMPPHVHSKPLYVDIKPEGNRLLGIASTYGTDSPEQARELLAESYDVDPESVKVRPLTPKDVNRLADSSTGKTFGFSNWSGCNWEPSGPTKPAGDPNLN